MRLKAVFVDSELREILTSSEIEGRVISVYDEVVYLRAFKGALFVLAKAEVGNGPRFILIKDKASFKVRPFSIRPDDIFKAYDETVVIDEERIVIDLAGSKNWNPALVCLQPVKLSRVGRLIWVAMSIAQASENKGGLRTLLPNLDDLFLQGARTKTRGGGAASFIYDRLANFARALCSGSEAEIKRSTLPIIGLGDGLTPSCDDLLVGVLGLMYCLKYSSSHKSFSEKAISSIGEALEQSKTKTNPISTHFLLEAVRGRFTERVKELLEAIFSDDDKRVETAVGRVLKYGATSGSDLICGIKIGARTL